MQEQAALLAQATDADADAVTPTTEEDREVAAAAAQDDGATEPNVVGGLDSAAGSGSSDGDSNTGIYVIVFVTLAIACLLLAAVLIAVMVMRKKRRQRQAKAASAAQQFHNDLKFGSTATGATHPHDVRTLLEIVSLCCVFVAHHACNTPSSLADSMPPLFADIPGSVLDVRWDLFITHALFVCWAVGGCVCAGGVYHEEAC